MENSLLEFYRSARSEIIDRIKLRDQIILGYLAGITALIAAAIVHESTAILLTIPVLAIGATVIVCQHQVTIRAITKYLDTELIPQMCLEKKGSLFDWPLSAARKEYRPFTDLLRYGGYFALLLGPCFAADLFFLHEVFYQTKDGRDTQLQVFWGIDITITIVVMLVLHLTWKGTARVRAWEAVAPWIKKELCALFGLPNPIFPPATTSSLTSESPTAAPRPQKII